MIVSFVEIISYFGSPYGGDLKHCWLGLFIYVGNEDSWVKDNIYEVQRKNVWRTVTSNT